MATLDVPYGGGDGRGRASFEELDNYSNQFLLAGDQPRHEAPIALPQKVSTTLARFTVVGLDANGFVVPASIGGTAVKPCGVVAHGSVVGAGGGNVEVFYSGCFNADADSPLVWDASYDTQAKKLAAFNETSLSVTTIVVRERT